MMFPPSPQKVRKKRHWTQFIFKMPLKGDVLVPWRVCQLFFGGIAAS